MRKGVTGKVFSLKSRQKQWVVNQETYQLALLTDRKVWPGAVSPSSPRFALDTFFASASTFSPPEDDWFWSWLRPQMLLPAFHTTVPSTLNCLLHTLHTCPCPCHSLQSDLWKKRKLHPVISLNKACSVPFQYQDKTQMPRHGSRAPPDLGPAFLSSCVCLL